MPLIRLRDVHINVRQWGDGDPLLLIHGLGTSSDLWVNQVRVFAERYRVVAVDVRGFGRSTWPSDKGGCDFAAVVDDLLVLCDMLDLRDVHILGTSMGGLIAQGMALSRPDLCRSLILCFTAGRIAIPPDVLETRLEALRGMSMDAFGALVTAQALAQPADPFVAEWLREMIAKNDREVYGHFLGSILADLDLTGRLGEIHVPTLVISGGEDRVIPAEQGAALSRRIAGSEYREIPSVGHIGYAEQPAVFNDCVLTFLRQYEARLEE